MSRNPLYTEVFTLKISKVQKHTIKKLNYDIRKINQTTSLPALFRK